MTRDAPTSVSSRSERFGDRVGDLVGPLSRPDPADSAVARTMALGTLGLNISGAQDGSLGDVVGANSRIEQLVVLEVHELLKGVGCEVDEAGEITTELRREEHRPPIALVLLDSPDHIRRGHRVVLVEGTGTHEPLRNPLSWRPPHSGATDHGAGTATLPSPTPPGKSRSGDLAHMTRVTQPVTPSDRDDVQVPLLVTQEQIDRHAGDGGPHAPQRRQSSDRQPDQHHDGNDVRHPEVANYTDRSTGAARRTSPRRT